MKAIVIDKFVSNLHELKSTDTATPKPTNQERPITIRITHAALTHVDLLYAQGKHQNNRRHAKPPFILGTEFAGVVSESSSLSKFKRGTRVFGQALGSFSEYICVDENIVEEVPKSWTNAEAVAVGASGPVSWASLVSAGKIKVGETVLVLGAGGGLGVIAIQIAKALGANVIGVVGDQEKAEVVRKLGADDVVLYSSPGWEERVRRATRDGEGVDLVYDSVGVIQSSIKCLRYGGRVVIVGFAGRGGKMEQIPANRILLKAATVSGYRFGEHSRRAPKETAALWKEFMQMVDKGSIKPVLYKEIYQGLESIPRALEDLEARKVWGRAVVKISKDRENMEAARL